jgi:hypothetical protein
VQERRLNGVVPARSNVARKAHNCTYHSGSERFLIWL